MFTRRKNRHQLPSHNHPSVPTSVGGDRTRMAGESSRPPASLAASALTSSVVSYGPTANDYHTEVGTGTPTQTPQPAPSSTKVDTPPPTTPTITTASSVPRLVVRNLPFHQSKNTVQVDHNQGYKIAKLVKHDLFHVLLRLPTYQSVLMFLTIWTVGILVWAGFYVAGDRQDPFLNCGLGSAPHPITYNAAFAFSLETCTTVGYGLPGSSNAFFENCPWLQVVIYLQMVWSMMFNAFLFAFFYSRVAKCESRAIQVLFSSKAIVSVTAGQVRFQMRVYDVDTKHPVVEAHARLYGVKKDRPVPRPMRILQPDDEFNSALFLSMPTVISHHIDLYSVLHPPRPTPIHPCGLILRQVDSATNNREEVACPICGESYGNYDRWVHHVRYQKIVESKDEYPVAGTHLSIPERDLVSAKRHQSSSITDIKTLQEYFRDQISEVILIVEGIDPLMSGTFQALQSYRFEDIVWDNGAVFSPCMSVDNDRHILRVDMEKFHDVDVPEMSDQQRHSLRTHDSFFYPCDCNDSKLDATTVGPQGPGTNFARLSAPPSHVDIVPTELSKKVSWMDPDATPAQENDGTTLSSDARSTQQLQLHAEDSERTQKR